MPNVPQRILRPGRIHRNLVTLFRRDPWLALECAHRASGRPPPEGDLVLLDRSTSLVSPTTGNELSADLLISVHRRNPDGSAGEILEVIWIVEVQMCRDSSRALAWSNYINAVAHAFEIDPARVEMLVVSPSVKIRSWLLHSLFPRMKIRPTLLTRAHVPRLHPAPRDGRVRIEPAVLSAVYHGRDIRNLATIRTAITAIQPLEHENPDLHSEYHCLILDTVHPDMTDFIPTISPSQDASSDPAEDLDLAPVLPGFEPDDDEFVTRWEYEGLLQTEIRKRVARKNHDLGHRRGFAQGCEQGLEQGLVQGFERGLETGHEQGLEAGLVQGRQEALQLVLDLRGFQLTSEQRRRIDGCMDPRQLNHWLERAKTAVDVSGLFG